MGGQLRASSYCCHMTLFVLAHAPSPDDRSPQAERLRRATETARQSGLKVVPLPFPFPDPDGVLPDSLPGDLAVYSGPIPRFPAHYRTLESALAARGATLVNSAAASKQATRIREWHALLGALTAKTVILHGDADLAAAIALGFPLFLKGLVKSAKEQGIEACLARDAQALVDRARGAWRQEQILAAREYLPLRQTGEFVMSFPQAREYRMTLLDGAILGQQFYWGADDPLGTISADEQREAQNIAVQAADLLDARLLAIDVGQLEDGSWMIVEVGDAQFTGLAHIPPHHYWTELKERLG